MSNIEKFSEDIATKILKILNIDDKDKVEVLAYGAFVLFQTILITIMVAIFGVVFNVLIESMVILFIASLLRKSSGGAHATSPMNCAIISVIIFGALALIVKHYFMKVDLLYIVIGMIISFIVTCYIIYKYSPVETPNKPLRNENTRKRLKKLSIKKVISLFVINIILMFTYLYSKQTTFITIAVCISTGVAWQSITMVSLGHKIIDGLDKVLRGTNR